MHELFSQILSYLRAVWRRRWYIAIVAWIVSAIGWIAVYAIPDRYEASARVYVDTQSILKPLLSGLTVQPNYEQMVSMMTRTLVSRPNLEKVARMTDLDLKAKTSGQTEALLDGLASNIRISGDPRDNLYTISYQNQDRTVAKRVVQSMLTVFVESGLGGKRKDVDSAKRFIDEQVKAYEQKLVTAENALKEFKRQHLGMMPGEGGGYYEKITLATNEANQARLSLREVENRRDALKRQLSGESEELPGENSVVTANPELDSRIQTLQKNLDNLRLTFTEQHPDIISTKRIIVQLEEQKKQEAKIRKPTSGTNPYYQQLSLSFAEAEANVASMRARVGEYDGRLAQLRAAAHNVPQVEADYTQLMRDYDLTKKNYEQLMSRSETASMSEEMGAKTDVIEFKIIDPPRVPTVPSAPNRPLLYSLVLLGGLVAGIALAFGVGLIRPTVDDRHGLRELTGLPMLGAVTMIWTNEQQLKRRKGMVSFAATMASLLAAYAVVLGVSLWALRLG
jgi:polysaccharide chain length determinant protein (PEP-CTERM system associated)